MPMRVDVYVCTNAYHWLQIQKIGFPSIQFYIFMVEGYDIMSCCLISRSLDTYICQQVTCYVLRGLRKGQLVR